MPTLIVPSSVVGGSSLNTADLLNLHHRIPPYQRDFVWTTKVVEEFWDDLITHYKRFSVNEALPTPEGYFLGAMVVVGEDEDQPFEVVDGQQRLTTLSTVISVIFDKLGELSVPEPYRSGYEQVARECMGRFVGGTYEANLTFSDPDVDTFLINSCLINRRHTDKLTYWSTSWCSQRLSREKSTIHRLQQAIECGYRKLESFLDSTPTSSCPIDRLMPFFRLVTECIVVLRIKAHSHPNAYAIFESLNNRGVRLSQADLIKNELLKVAMPSNRDDIIENWSYIRQNVDATDILSLPDFLHFSYLSRYEKVKANDLFASIKTRFSSGGTAALNYSEELNVDAASFDALANNFSASWTTKTHAMLNDIKNVLGIKLCYPFLFSVYRKYATLAPEFEKYVRLVMNCAFRHLKVLEGSVDALAVAINSASDQVNAGKPFNELADIFRTLTPDPLFQQAFETVSFLNTKLAYFAVYYLESVRLHGTIPLPHSQESNLEHIMPRTPTLAYWPAMYTEKNANPEIFREHLWKVGNLLPLPESINKSIKNKDIAYKIANGTGSEYSTATLTLISPKEVSNYLISGEWTYQSIINRQKDLAAIAPQAWPL
jgi:hypothetical protein